VTAAPDLIQPIVGWRAWLVVRRLGEPRLRSVMHDVEWPVREELLGSCLDKLTVRPSGHPAPASGCGCGIYASRSADDAAAYLDRHCFRGDVAVHRLIGRVSLWGAVLECESGWRAARAYPLHLYVAVRTPAGDVVQGVDEIALGLTEYGVDVELLDCTTNELADALREDIAA
jgi:hypothetical protein